MRIHWGEPINPLKLRAYTGALLAKDGDLAASSLHFTDHHVTRWYGVSFGLDGFLGWLRFGATDYPREVGCPPGFST